VESYREAILSFQVTFCHYSYHSYVGKLVLVIYIILQFNVCTFTYLLIVDCGAKLINRLLLLI
jgi:hypothetical protein